MQHLIKHTVNKYALVHLKQMYGTCALHMTHAHEPSIFLWRQLFPYEPDKFVLMDPSNLARYAGDAECELDLRNPHVLSSYQLLTVRRQ
jgi:hypothetical protein